jgi:hypothetical protein
MRSYRSTSGYSTTLYYRSGAVSQMRVGSSAVYLYDNNCDGQYTLADDTVAADVPMRGPAAFAPLGKHIATKRGVWTIEALEADGSKMTCKKYDGETAEIKIAYPSRQPQAYLAFTGKGTDCNFSAAVGGYTQQQVDVVPGAYTLSYGIVCNKRGDVVASVSTGKSEPIQAEAGQKVQGVYGAPYALTFKPAKRGNNIYVSPSFDLFGKGGEEYHSFDIQSSPRLTLVQGNQQVALGSMGFG